MIHLKRLKRSNFCKYFASDLVDTPKEFRYAAGLALLCPTVVFMLQLEQDLCIVSV